MFSRLFPSLVLLALTLLGGCGHDSEVGSTEPANHHDHDHFVPDHWPSSIADGVEKIERRLAALRDNDQEQLDARVELQELVSWLPEIAADTELSEADWLPIYEASEQLRAPLDRFAMSDEMELDASVNDSLTKLIESGKLAAASIGERTYE